MALRVDWVRIPERNRIKVTCFEEDSYLNAPLDAAEYLTF